MPKNHALTIPFALADFQKALLNWYDGARRDLPWRAKPGCKPDPYSVWLSEIMLQQTTVKAVIPYFENFIAKWPTAGVLGAASRDEILAAWAGLGYYSRARNLHACAQAVVSTGFPKDEAALCQLPGIGTYTAAAIAAIAFDKPAAAVDGNAERVLARLFALAVPLPAAKPLIRAAALRLIPKKRPGDYAQAMMDLGATVCTPRASSCPVCPVRGFCAALAGGEPERYPVKTPKAARPLRRGDAFVVVRNLKSEPQILLRRRPEKGLLGGMMEVPGTEWVVRNGTGEVCASIPGNWRQAQTVRHTFTHFHLEMRVFAAPCAEVLAEAREFGGEWAPLAGLARFALPSVMKKAVAAGFEALGIETASAQRAGSAASSASKVSSVERSARPSTRAGRK